MACTATLSNANGFDEANLIRHVVSGRRDLFGDLIAPHLKPLLRSVQAILGYHPDVDDVVQQTALQALIHLEQFRFEANFRTWLIRIGINEARQWRRRSASWRFRVRSFPNLNDLGVADKAPSALAECQRVDSGVRVHAALNLLPEKYRVVVVLRDFEGMRLSDVAQRLDLSVPAVKSRHLRAMKKMARSLAANQ